MKKWTLILCTVILITVIFYFFLPASVNLNYKITVNCTESAAARQITDKNKWQLWWPGEKKSDTIYTYKNIAYRINKILLNGIEATIFNKKASIKGTLLFIYYGNDSTQFQFTSNYSFSANPFKRFIQFIELKNIKNNVENLLADIKNYFDNTENIYGMKIVKQKVTESSMISVKQTFTHYPSTREIYSMINSVKEYIQKAGGEESSFPMLHVEKEDPSIYETMVAIPTKSDLPSKDKFRLKKMVLGNILMAEVKGGIYTVIKGEEELANYVNDYKKTSPAISFQSLVTNRLQEKDTSKWITRLYYPIFN